MEGEGRTKDGETAQGSIAARPGAGSVRYQLRYGATKRLPHIGQYRQYSRTG